MATVPLPSVGDLVSGKYRIESVIGEGGMGVVLGAVDTSLGRPVAIKFLTPARALNEAAATRFGREARAAASIQSEHVVRVYEVGALPNGAPFIVMEHLKGSDLAHVVETRGGLPIDEASDLLLQACEALGEAHARGIVHRDLKPQNLFLTQRNDGSACLKVLDFGISKSAETEGSSPKLTSTDMVMGTPLYMSPEQVRSLKSVDARADIWALGAILHELLTASPPFDGPTASALHAAIAMDPPTPLRSRRPDAPAELEAIVARCLEKKPDARYQDVGALAAALAPFATERGRNSAGRIGDVVKTTTGSSRSSSKPSGDAPTIPLGVASTLNAFADRGATDGSWEQPKGRTSGPPEPRPAPPRFRAGMIAAAILLIGGAGVVGFAIAKRSAIAPPAAATAATVTPVEAPPSAVVLASPPPIVPIPEVVVPEVGTADPPAPPRARKSADRKKVVERAAADQQDTDRENQCRDARRRMREFPDNPVPAATIVKGEFCNKGDRSTYCELEVCLEACRIVKDELCQRFVGDRLMREPK